VSFIVFIYKIRLNCLFESAFGCFKGAVVYLSCICFFLLFGSSRIDLAFGVYGYMATLFLWDVCLYGCLSLLA